MGRRQSVECTICLNTLQTCDPDVVILTQCDHLFHLPCVARWWDGQTEPSCPTCRRVCTVAEALDALDLPPRIDLETWVFVPTSLEDAVEEQSASSRGQVFRVRGSLDRRSMTHVLSRRDLWTGRLRLARTSQNDVYVATVAPEDMGPFIELWHNSADARTRYMTAVLDSLGWRAGAVIWRWPQTS